MSAWRPTTCLLCRITQSVEAVLPRGRKFHSSPLRRANRKPTYPNIKASDMSKVIDNAARVIPKYSEEEKAKLAKKYTPEQLKVVELGEEAIDPKDLAGQGEVRKDFHQFKYLDDFSTIRPVIDKKPKAPDSHFDPKLRYKTDDEIIDSYAEFFAKVVEEKEESGRDFNEEALAERLEQFEQREFRVTVGKEEAERAPTSHLAPEIPRWDDPAIRFLEGDQHNLDQERLKKQTGFSDELLRKFRVKILVNHRVVNQTRMGKIQSYYALSVAGDGNGLVGIGEGKSTEEGKAKQQSIRSAIRHMEPIKRYEQRPTYGQTEAKVGASIVKIMTRPPGFGLRCQHGIFEICRCAGITDLAARVSRSRNPMNVAKATLAALKKQKSPEDIARGRGKKLVDVRKVYYGNLH